MTTYAELVTQIRAYTEVDSSVLSDTIVNDFIEFAENRLFRDVDIDVFKSHQTANLTASNPFAARRLLPITAPGWADVNITVTSSDWKLYQSISLRIPPSKYSF